MPMNPRSFLLRSTCFFATLAALPGCLPVVAAGAGAGGVAAVQERTVGNAMDDLTIDTKVNNKLIQSSVRDLQTGISTKVTEGVVVLTGKVTQAEYSVEAVRLTWEVPGVREVVNEIQVVDPHNNSTTYPRDAWITAQVKTRLIAEKYVKSVNYNIETVNSTVYVMGIAQNEPELNKVLNVASRVSGVVQVISHVRLKDDPRRPIPTVQPSSSPSSY